MTTLVSYALTTLDDVKESLGIPSGNTTKDNLIRRKINQATAMIESFCNLPIDHHFKETVYTDELYDGSGTYQLLLMMYPVKEITSLSYRVGSENNNNYDTLQTEDYFLDKGTGIISGTYRTNDNVAGYKVTYTAGYSTIPPDLSEACVALASFLVENATTGTNVKRKREGQREVEYFAANSSNGSGGTSSLIEELGLDDVLNRYVIYVLR